MIPKIISGGQTGADRAALDFAIKHRLSYGGWLPKGRKTEDGPLDPQYQLQEMPTGNYAHRTEQNVLDADGTVIVSHGVLTGGSALTREFARRHGRHWIHIDLAEVSPAQAAARLSSWVTQNNVRVLNVAGPKAGKDPKIYKAALNLLEKAFAGETTV